MDDLIFFLYGLCLPVIIMGFALAIIIKNKDKYKEMDEKDLLKTLLMIEMWKK